MSNDVNNDLITVEQARKILGSRTDNLTDEQITDLLNMLRLLCSKQIDSATQKNRLNKELNQDE